MRDHIFYVEFGKMHYKISGHPVSMGIHKHMNWIISHIHTVSKHSYKNIYRVWLQCNIIMNRYQNLDITIFIVKN